MTGAPVGARLLTAVAVMHRLRSPGGCPWDAAQTHRSLAPYLVEETYELLDAIDSGDPAALREELGDVLLQVLFHSRIAAEGVDQRFDIDDVATDLVAKLTRRHPRVFADPAESQPALGADPNPDADWETLKQAEKRRASVTDGIATGQPALALAAALYRRGGRRPELAARAWAATQARPPDGAAPDPGGPHLADPETVAGPPEPDGFGAQLFTLAGRAAAAGIDPEQALRGFALRYRGALRSAEGLDS